MIARSYIVFAALQNLIEKLGNRQTWVRISVCSIGNYQQFVDITGAKQFRLGLSQCEMDSDICKYN